MSCNSSLFISRNFQLLCFKKWWLNWFSKSQISLYIKLNFLAWGNLLSLAKVYSTYIKFFFKSVKKAKVLIQLYHFINGMKRCCILCQKISHSKLDSSQQSFLFFFAVAPICLNWYSIRKWQTFWQYSDSALISQKF